MSEVGIRSFQVGDTQWKKYRHRALTDLYWFNAVVLGYQDKIPMREGVHLLLCKFVEKRTGSSLLDSARYRKIEMPRETGKSTLITQGYAIQRICQNPSVAILLINEKEKLAGDFLAGIKWHFENNDFFRRLFPEVIPDDFGDTTWSSTRIVVKRKSGRPDPTVDIAGVGGAITGKHPDLILCDDIISREAMENARAGAWQIMHQTNRWIHQLEPIVNKSAEPFPETIFIGTRWWINDSYEHIEESYGNGEEPRRVLLRAQLPNNELQQVEAYRKGDLAVFRRAAIEDNRSIFPEKWSLEDLAKMRMRDPALFACNYMNRPADDVTATFKENWKKVFVWLDDDQFYFADVEGKKQIRQLRDLDKIILVDPGGFAAKMVEDRARATAVVLGDDLKGSYFFLDCYSEKDTFLAAIRQIVNMAQRFRPRKIYVERAAQQAAFAELLRRDVNAAFPNGDGPVVDDTTLKPGNASGEANKALRILEMEPYFQRGQIYVGTGPNFLEFNNQYQQFPRSARLDVLDVLGYWPRLMKKYMPNGSQSTQERQAQERAAWRSRLATLRR